MRGFCAPRASRLSGVLVLPRLRSAVVKGSHLAYAVAGLAALIVAFGLSRNGARVATGDPIRIAFAGPVTGPSGEDGQSAVNAIELVFERANAAGGVGGRPLELVTFDDRNDAELARARAPRIAEDRSIVAVIGHNYSTCSMAAGEVYRERGVPAVSTAATNVAVTRDNPWYFRVIFNDRVQGRSLVLYAHDVLGAERFGIIHETERYGAYLAEVMAQQAPRVGIELVRSWAYDPAAANLDSTLARIVREALEPAAPGLLVLAVQPSAGAKLVKLLRDGGYAGVIVASDTLASQAFIDALSVYPEERARPGFYSDGVYASTPFLFDVGGKDADRFSRLYLRRYGRPPTWYAAFAADAATVLIEAMRRRGISPVPDTIKDDRAALRDSLAGIDALEPVHGITGANWFDTIGDMDKPVPMARFVRQELVSAWSQLELLPYVEDLDDLDDAHDPERVTFHDGDAYYRKHVARVGLLARKMTAVDFDAGTFDIDFDLWFRDNGVDDLEDVEFTNAVEPVVLGEPEEELYDAGVRYRRYRVEGTFRADTLDAGYGGHTIAISLRHRLRTSEDLVLAVDQLGMGLDSNAARERRLARASSILPSHSRWTITDLMVFEEDVDEPALGHPAYITGVRPVRSFSQLTIAASLGPRGTRIADLVPAAALPLLFTFSLLASLALMAVSKTRHPKLGWAVQSVVAVVMLAAAEPVVGNWILANWGAYYTRELPRLFGALWWLLPAVLLNLAVARFVWAPAEGRSGFPVPSVLRYSVAVVIYVLAFFGVIAFVYDYRLTGLLATSGVLAMVFGLAVQLNITNLFAGVALNMERPFRVGDWIMIHGPTPDPASSVIGMVTDINWRTTRLQTADDTVIVIPNGSISEKTVTNFMSPTEMSRFELYFTVDQSVEPDRAIAVMREAVYSIAGAERDGPLADPEPTVRINKTTENGIEYVIRYRIVPRDVSPLKARHTINESVIRHLHASGIQLATPRRRIEEASAPDRTTDA
ncbi:MAG: mechanosensitive ion channel [Myxococcales bacterium]|nr:MAG: mechanosensitive ion channel [Myxococcales bacterium]